jgi:hypothetical protein
VNWRIAAAVKIAIVLQPLATFGVPGALSFPAETTSATLVLGSLPAGFFGILFAVSYRPMQKAKKKSAPAPRDKHAGHTASDRPKTRGHRH